MSVLLKSDVLRQKQLKSNSSLETFTWRVERENGRKFVKIFQKGGFF